MKFSIFEFKDWESVLSVDDETMICLTLKFSTYLVVVVVVVVVLSTSLDSSLCFIVLVAIVAGGGLRVGKVIFLMTGFGTNSLYDFGGFAGFGLNRGSLDFIITGFGVVVGGM